MKPVNRGGWNHLIVFLGQPGTGKSTAALKRAKELGRAPSYVLAHDPGWRLPDDASLMRHASFGEAAAGLASNPGAVHALSIADGEMVVAWSIQCARASLNSGGGVPVTVLLDEGVSTSGINPYRLSPQMRDFIATRRHHNVGMIVTLQSPSLAHYQLLGLATEIVMFRTIDEKGLRRLESIGVPRATLERVKTLPDFQSVTYSTQR